MKNNSAQISVNVKRRKLRRDMHFKAKECWFECSVC